LEEIVEDERFEDWFFLFGTIVASQELPKGDGYDHLFYNFAPLYKGFNPNDPLVDPILPMGKRFLLPKRYASDSDFLKKPNLNPQSVKEISIKGGWEELLNEQNQPNVTDNPFYVPHKRYADHLYEEYKHSLANNAAYTMIEYDWLVLDGIVMTVGTYSQHIICSKACFSSFFSFFDHPGITHPSHPFTLLRPYYCAQRFVSIIIKRPPSTRTWEIWSAAEPFVFQVPVANVVWSTYRYLSNRRKSD
jgi:hypothetical protein